MKVVLIASSRPYEGGLYGDLSLVETKDGLLAIFESECGTGFKTSPIKSYMELGMTNHCLVVGNTKFHRRGAMVAITTASNSEYDFLIRNHEYSEEETPLQWG